MGGAGARLEAHPPLASLRAQDHWRVNLREPWEIRFWAREFGCTEEELRQAVRAAGDMAGRVRAWLAGGPRIAEDRAP